MTTTTQDRRAWRGRTWLLAAPLLACVPQAAHAEKLLPGFFTGGASVLYADASTGVLSLQLTHFAHTNCPCAGTNGHALVSRVGPLAIPGSATTSETAARTVATRTTTTADAEETSSSDESETTVVQKRPRQRVVVRIRFGYDESIPFIFESAPIRRF